MYKYIKLLLFCLCIIDGTIGQCVFKYGTNLPQTSEPIYVRRSSNQIYGAQNQQGQFSVAQNEEILFVCTSPASRNTNFVKVRINNVVTNAGTNLLVGRCNANRITLQSNQVVNFGDIGCNTMPAAEIIDNPAPNPPNTRLIQVGFRTSPTLFIERYRVSFNTASKTTYYAFTFLQATPFSCVVDARPNFRADGFGLTAAALNQDYTTKSTQIGKQLDRGHLVPKCDFFTPGEQYSTFFYVNANPQLHEFNNGNWKNLERFIRESINRVNGAVLQAYTGSSGLSRFGYLHGTNQVPIPLYFWKVLIDVRTRRGVAFIGVNEVTNRLPPLCADVCNRVQWLSSFDLATRSRVNMGVVYCCTVDEFQRIASIVKPPFPTYAAGQLLTTI